MKLLSIIMVSMFTINAYARPIIIGHRGASGHRPEHTLASYSLAIEFGADFIEPDLVMTKDGVLIARHENEISETTDVALKFPDRKTTKIIDGEKKTGWFTEDFTLKEIKSLRAKERLASRSHAYDGQFEIPTFTEVLELLKLENNKRKRPVGVYPEVKHPSYFKNMNLPLEDALIKELSAYGLNKKNSPVFIQSFEMSSLKYLKTKTPVPLVFLIGEPQEVPYDHILAGDKRTYLDLIQPASLKELSVIIAGIGPNKRMIIPEVSGVLQTPTDLIKYAHAAGLKVHPYTFRSDKEYLHPSYGGDPEKEYHQFFKAAVDGLFSDFPDHAVKALKSFKVQKK